MSLLDVPSEVLLLIISYLDIPQVLSLRQTCRDVSHLTRDKTVWFAFLNKQRELGDIPFTHAVGDPATPLVELAPSALESIVVSAKRAADAWMLPRESHPILQPPLVGESLNGLNIFLDAWLLIVYLDGLVYLWNIQNSPQQGLCATLDLREQGIIWRSYSASLTRDNRHIMLAMSYNSASFETVLYQINIEPSDSAIPRAFTLVRSFGSTVSRTIRTIDVSRQLVAFSYSSHVVDIVCWGTEKDCETYTFPLDAAEELYNGIIALRLLCSHFLAIRTHTIELHPCPLEKQRDPGDRPRLALKHALPFPLREGAVSVSDAEILRDPGSLVRHVRIKLLAYDAHSLTAYTVRLILPDAAAAAVPTMDVAFIGEVRGAAPAGGAGPMVRSHWFVSAHALGPQAVRALWVERDSPTMTRRVMVCTLNRHEAVWHDMGSAASVYALQSYDLREDLTHCALGEASGRIVLGNRAGHVFLLS
ncbi:hypothetical protein B0H10DRAFT_2017324 [Mycena sp. CBHHK59/15]|nr:hypothetical protein B0H10DRAFT_2017324 [Mycena sp. CBHHK59/15]